MSAEGRRLIQRFHADISGHLDQIRQLFKEPDQVRISLILRPTGEPDQADFITNDETESVISAIRFLESSKHTTVIDTRTLNPAEDAQGGAR